MLRLLLLLLLPSTLLAAEPMRFQGIVEPSARAELATLISGVVRTLHFETGDQVAAGQLLAEVEPVDDTQSQRLAAEAELAARQAELADRQLVLEQQTQLRQRNVASDLAYRQALHAAEGAGAGVKAATAALAEAERRQGLRRLTAPIAGVVGQALVSQGAFVEAEAGSPLVAIEQLDPVLVGYAVPYAERLAALRAAKVATIEELLARVELRLKLPGGIDYPSPGRPFASNVRLDADGNLKVWAAFPNPDRVLLPGLPVDVESIVKTGE